MRFNSVSDTNISYFLREYIQQTVFCKNVSLNASSVLVLRRRAHLGISRKHGGDGNENGRKRKDLMSKTRAMLVAEKLVRSQILLPKFLGV